MDIRYNNTTILSFEPSGNQGKETRELMSDCFVETSFVSATLYSLKAGYYIDVDSKRYWLKEDYKPSKDSNTGGFVYDLRFHGIESLLADHICFFITADSKESNWNLTGVTLTQIGQVIADNLERAGFGTFTILGSDVIGSVSGSGSSVLDVLNDVANKWGVEWWFDGSVLKFGEHKSVDAVDFVVGDVIRDYSPENSMDSDFATRLYAFGSTKNITSDYRNTGTITGMVERRLRMPVATGDFIDISGATRIVEKVKIYEECYPRRVGTISSAFKVGNFWRFKDTTSPFNPLTEPIVKVDGSAGNKISVIFESGNLAGREFELLFFADNGEYVYEIVEKQEGENIDLKIPNDTLCPVVGDTYSLYGMAMPVSFTTLAESELQGLAQSDLAKMYGEKQNYSCPTNKVYCRTNDKKYYVGQSVTLTRHDGTTLTTRIRKVERSLYDAYDCTYTLGEKQRYSLFNDLKNKIEKPLTFSQIKTQILTIVEDGAITQSERATLEMALKQLDSEFQGVDANFDVIYANTYLTTEVKADLLSKFNTYSSKYTALINAINGAILDDVITAEEKDSLNTKFSEYATSFAALSTSVESAKKSITDSIGTTLENWVADGVISPLEKLAVKQTRTQVLSEKTSLLEEAIVYEIDSTDFAAKWAVYDAVLAKYSSDATENIAIESDFATAESDYAAAKTTLKTALSTKQWSTTTDKHPLGGHADLDLVAKDIDATRIISDEVETPEILSPNFVSGGFMGSGFGVSIDANGKAKLEIDELLVRHSAKFYELIIQQLKHQGGIVFYTAASMEVLSVTEQADSYRCFFDTKQGQLTNEWAVNDQARCQRFAGKYYWRLVTAVGTDYIDLSKADTNGAGVPEKGDVIVQLGNRTDTARQAAKVTIAVGADSPRDELYEGINSFDLTGKLITIVGMKDGKAGIYTVNGEFSGKVNIGAGSTGLTGLAEWAGAAQDIQDAQSTANQGVHAAASLQSYIDNNLPQIIADIQAQIDKQVEYWDFSYAPTLSNYPASEWTTDALKDRHIHDTFYNNQPFVDNTTTPDAGKAWRFTKSGGTYFWNPISDSDAVKALADAAKAQDTADGKRRVFVTQPSTPYDVGDLWTQGTAGDIMRCINARLSGAYVAGDWEKAVKYTDDTAVNSLQIGGRNLLLGSATFKSWAGNGQAIIGNELRLPYDGADRYVFSTNVDAAIGKVVTVSFKAKVAGASNANGALVSNFDQSQVFNVFALTDTYAVKSFTYVWTGSFLIGTISANIPGAYLYIKDVKVELGNKATDWTPAPEDVEALIQDQQIYVEYSIDGSTAWHTTFTSGDIFMRQKKGSGAWSAAIRIVGEKGDAGNEGRYTDYQFAKNTSDTTAPTSNWQDAPPAISAGEYVWMRVGEVIPPATSPASWSAAVRITGNKGDTGLQGIPGNPGADGITYYTWVKYADTPTTGMSDFPSGKAYLGIAYNKTTATESTNYADYSWSLIKGTDGQPGADGADGQTLYTWIKYADTPTTGMSDSPTGKTYIGIAVNKTTSVESTAYGDYTWSLIKGADGKSVTATDVEFAQTASATVAPTTGWQTTAPAWVDGQYIWTRTKTTYSDASSTYSAAVNLTGAKGTTGSTGSTGTGVDTITEEYYLSTSKTTQTGGAWSTTPPTWSSGKYVWTRVKIVYKNPASTVYTTAVVSSEWEAVNEIQIGGRNLLLNSATFAGWAGSGFSIVGNEARLITDGGDRYVFGPNVSAAVGKLVTVSCKAKIVGATGASLIFLANFGQSHQSFGVNLSSTYQVFSFTYLYTTNFLLGTSQQNIAGAYIYFKDVKVESGNKATDYTQAPEDITVDYTSKIAAAQATADVAAAKTQGMTTFEGGYMTTSLIKLMDALANAETAGINGMKGNGNNPAFWAGGTYAQALQMLAAIVLKHNGAGKIGDLIIEENGTVVVKDPTTGQIRVVWNATELPLLADLLSQSQISDSEINSAANRTTPGTTMLANNLVVTKANSKLTFDADISGSATAPSAGTALISVAVNLYKDGVIYTPISSFSYRLEQPGNPSASFNEAIDFVLNSVPVGTYSIGLTIGATSDGSSDWAISATLGASTLAFVFEQDIEQVRYGLDGWMAFYSSSKYFYLTSKSGVPFMKIRGDLDIPGLRCAASVAADGVATKMCGIAISSVLSSTGIYVITHNIGHLNYSVQLTIRNSSARINGVVTTKDANSFAVRIVNVYTDALTNSAFEFQLNAND